MSEDEIRVIRLRPQDVSAGSDHLRAFRQLISANEENYPSIHAWMETKVFEGIRTGERVAFVGYQGSRPAISAVVKRGAESKFCHLRVDDDLQNMNLGDMFFAMMATEVRKFASEVHFTLPESLWELKSRFFREFGFSSVEVAHTQYRAGEAELRCSAPFQTVWQATMRKMPKLSRMFSSAGYQLDIPLLMSVRPRFAEAIFHGNKRFEIRRKFSNRWLGARTAILATRPIGALMGEATVNSIRTAKPEVIWESFGRELGCTQREFLDYCEGAVEVFAIELTRVTPYMSPVPIRQLAHLLHVELVTPQSYSDVSRSSPWREALSMAAMLHGSLETRPQPKAPTLFPRIVLPDENLPLFGA
jgi:predicted transcriptional regulator